MNAHDRPSQQNYDSSIYLRQNTETRPFNCVTLICLTLLSYLFVGAASVNAQNDWLFPGNGLWSDSRRWEPGVPEADETARFMPTISGFIPTYAATTVTLRFDEEAGSLQFFRSNVLLRSNVQGTQRHLRLNDSGRNLELGAGLNGQNTVVALKDIHLSTGLSEDTPSRFATIDDEATLNVGENSKLSNLTGHLNVGNLGGGTINLTDGGIVETLHTRLGYQEGSDGTANVSGDGSMWSNAGGVYVGLSGNGTLNVNEGGSVSSQHGIIGQADGSSGAVTVSGSGSMWTNTTNLTVGGEGAGTLTIESEGAVIAGQTSIGANGSVIMNGGRFEFGTLDIDDFAKISGNSGSLAGLVNHGGFTNVATLTGVFNGVALDIGEVNVVNSGTLYGSGFLGSGLDNQSNAELTTLSNDFIRFEGNSANSGLIQNLGGLTEFASDLTNQNGGRISSSGTISVGNDLANEDGGEVSLFESNLIVGGSFLNTPDAVLNLSTSQVDVGNELVNYGLIDGRGLIRANGGIVNHGNMEFAGGATDFRGATTNNGMIVTSGNSTTIFFDGLENQGVLSISDGSSVVVFGEFSGDSDQLGKGDLFLEGGVNGGNSPAILSFDGNLTLGSNSSALIELAGTELGDFDRFEIGGNLSIFNGAELKVELIDGFELGYNQAFEFAEVNGTLNGQFSNFAEGDLVGSFSGLNLFISYVGGDGNDIVLFTAVPEPSTAVVGLLILVCGLTRRKRRD